MKLTIVIVNYNVKYFIEQCLHSVEKAITQIDAEVIVVDNNSVDGSCAMILKKFPDVNLIENKKNTGFSVANNQAIKIAKGEYVLLLNPDTVVEEDSFAKLLNFADSHPDAGGIGVKMIDGKGHFLPESKRALPTPEIAFYKMFGLSTLFPHSKRFARYHLGHLDKDKIHEVEVLSGAFMLLRKKVIDKIGMLDESFFMYGEDIDLSYRITQAGYKNYYFPVTTIIHYKGESTKKGSVNYVLMFYNAMIIFANKHFSGKRASLFALLINISIYFKAALAIVGRFIKKALFPILDAIIIFTGFIVIKMFWEHYKFGDSTYPSEFLQFAVPSYIIIWLTSLYFAGAYEQSIKVKNIIKGLGLGTIVILVIYSLLNEEFRFSRALILLGFAWSMFSLIVLRFIAHLTPFFNFKLDLGQQKKIVIVGTQNEYNRISNLLNQLSLDTIIIGSVSPEKENESNNSLGDISQLHDIVVINSVDEVVFSSKDISAQMIIRNMHQLSDISIDYKIAPPESFSVIGSNSIETAGDLYVIDNNTITKLTNVRKKRLFDIIVSLQLLIVSPVLIIFQKKRSGFIKNIFNVLFGKKTWVGYYSSENVRITNLPELKQPVLTPLDNHRNKTLSDKQIEKLNLIYSKDYRLINDFSVIISGINYLGRNI